MNARKCISDVRFELQIFSALTQTHNERYGFQLVQSYMDQMQAELLEAVGLEEAAVGTEFVEQATSSRTNLLTILTDVLPSVIACSRANGDMEPALQALQLIRAYRNRDGPEFVDVRSQDHVQCFLFQN